MDGTEKLQAACNDMQKRQLEEAFKELTDREAKILELRYGLVDGKPRTLEEIADIFGVTMERVRQVEAKAIKKLRKRKISQ